MQRNELLAVCRLMLEVRDPFYAGAVSESEADDMARTAIAQAEGQLAMQPTQTNERGQGQHIIEGCLVEAHEGGLRFLDPADKYSGTDTMVGHGGTSYAKAKKIAKVLAQAPELAAQRDEFRSVLQLLHAECMEGTPSLLTMEFAANALKKYGHY